jgi:hypothetical protein
MQDIDPIQIYCHIVTHCPRDWTPYDVAELYAYIKMELEPEPAEVVKLVKEET